ncbi:ribonuclease III domain-containing protein [Gymnopilus junonius]|uniref:Ribonuclease III domain-containing protein n=1 Tax=Gymnopilus junonius TaxID=109634 RepID=A0A9P5TQJ5_GYMJU|nr:ribonuclease III domain-containing protein [Gymnopilus junonius]
MTAQLPLSTTYSSTYLCSCFCFIMSPLFPFTDPRCHLMQRAAVALIESPKFFFTLPALTHKSWTLVNTPSAEKQRLEFLGDALIGSCISEELFHCRPHEGPGFYTNARSVLTANSTFAHLMCKVGLYKPGDPVKPAGDTFETILAAYHSEKGPEAFKIYIRTYFVPLILSVSKAHDQYRQTRIRTRKNICFGLDSEPRRLDNAKSKLREKIGKQPTKHGKTFYPPRHLPGRPAKKSLIIIDLSDLTSDDEDTTSCRVVQGPIIMPKTSTAPTASTSKATLGIDLTAYHMQKNAGGTVGANVRISEGLHLRQPDSRIMSCTHTPRLSHTQAPSLTLPQSSFAFASNPRTTQRDIVLNLGPNSGQPSVSGSIDNPILID